MVAQVIRAKDLCRVHGYMPYYVDFREGVKPEYPEKNPRSTGEINCGNFFLFDES